MEMLKNHFGNLKIVCEIKTEKIDCAKIKRICETWIPNNSIINLIRIKLMI